MLKDLALDNIWDFFSGRGKAKVKVINKRSEVSNTRYWLAIVLIAANGFVLLSYVYGVNQSASSGYEIQQLQTQLTALTASNKQVNLQIAEASSMVDIQNDFLSANFVPAGTPIFLTESPQEFSMNQK